MKSKKAVD